MRIPPLHDIPKPIAVEPGEYDLIIRKVDDCIASTGRPGLAFIFNIIGVENTLPVRYWLYTAMEGDDEDTANFMWGGVRDFIDAIGLDSKESHENSDFVGLHFTAELSVGEYKDEPTNELVRVTG